MKLIRRRASNGSKELARALEIKRNRLDMWPPFVSRKTKVIINWGNAQEFAASTAHVLNKPAAVRNAVNKLTTFHKLEEARVNIPTFQTEPPTAQQRRNTIWLARQTLTGSAGEGIVVIRPDDALPQQAQLYVKYIKKLVELRLHVVRDEVILVTQKRKRDGAEQDANQKLIRSYDNGWVHAVHDQTIEITEEMQIQALNAVQALNLDFGAVDMVIDKDTNVPYVLEVNTAPGISGESTIEAYKNAFTKAYQELTQ